MGHVSVICKLAMKWYLMRMCADYVPLNSNLVPKAHVPFGQHQDTDTCLGADQKARGLWERDCLNRGMKVLENVRFTDIGKIKGS